MSPRLLAWLLSVVPLCPAVAADPIAPASTLVPASDAHYRFEGRLDRSDPRQPVLIWSGSRVSLDFEGAFLAVIFGAASDQSVFNVTVDGETEIADVRAGSGFRFVWPRPLGKGRHHLELFKRSEAAKGHVALVGVELAKGAKTWAPSAPAYRVKFEFFGDSITAGACNEDGAVDQWDDFRTHNHALSYGYLTSQAFAADHRALAVSGMGIAIGWVEVKAGQIWDKVYPRPDSPKADLRAWQPDVAFVNYGENDDSYSNAQKLGFPAGYTPGYVSLVKTIRAAYPKAEIVLLRGGMTGGAQSPALKAAWEAAVQELESGDPKIAHYVFQHWSALHPRVADDRAMADELTVWLKQQAFMTSFLPR